MHPDIVKHRLIRVSHIQDCLGSIVCRMLYAGFLKMESYEHLTVPHLKLFSPCMVHSHTEI